MAPSKRQGAKRPTDYDETPESEVPEEQLDVHWISDSRDNLEHQPSLEQLLQNIEHYPEECHRQLTSLWEMILTAWIDHHESQSQVEALEAQLQPLE